MPSKMETELERLRARVTDLEPKPAPPAPTWTGTQALVKFRQTYWLTSPNPGPGTEVVPDGDARAASLLGRGGIETLIDAGWVKWLRHLGVAFEELR